MKIGIRISLALGIALLGASLFERLLTAMIYSSWFNDSPGTDVPYSTDLRKLYVFAYVAVFALAWALRWQVSVKQQLVASVIALVGAILPFVAELTHWYLRAHWPLGDIFNATERSALATLLIAHGVALALINGLFLLTKPNRPLQGPVVPTQAPGNVAHSGILLPKGGFIQ
jgi:hypothetical protein